MAVRVRLGDLDKRVTILNPTTVESSRGDATVSYAEPDVDPEIYASIDPLQGRELVVAKQVRADVTHSVTVRYRDDIGPRTRLRWWDGRLDSNDDPIYRYFELGAGLNRRLANDSLRFYAIEVQNIQPDGTG